MLPVFSIPRIRKRLNLQKYLPPAVVVQPMASRHGAWLAHSPRVNGARYVSTWTTDQILGPQAYESALAAFHAFIAQLNKKRWLDFSNSGIERFQFVHDDPFGGHTGSELQHSLDMQMVWGAPEEEWSTGEFIMASTLPVYEFASTTPARECFGTDDQFMSPVIHGPGFGIRTPFAPWNFQTFCLNQEMMNELSDFPEGGSSNKLKATSPASGLKLLHHPDIVSNWKKSLKVRKKHPNAALIPCAATKPFPEAPSHRHGYLEALEGKDVDIYVVSEPLGIVPYSWSEKYPNNAYDFPPKACQRTDPSRLGRPLREMVRKDREAIRKDLRSSAEASHGARRRRAGEKADRQAVGFRLPPGKLRKQCFPRHQPRLHRLPQAEDPMIPRFNLQTIQHKLRTAAARPRATLRPIQVHPLHPVDTPRVSNDQFSFQLEFGGWVHYFPSPAAVELYFKGETWPLETRLKQFIQKEIKRSLGNPRSHHAVEDALYVEGAFQPGGVPIKAKLWEDLLKTDVLIFGREPNVTESTEVTDLQFRLREGNEFAPSRVSPFPDWVRPEIVGSNAEISFYPTWIPPLKQWSQDTWLIRTSFRNRETLSLDAQGYEGTELWKELLKWKELGDLGHRVSELVSSSGAWPATPSAWRAEVNRKSLKTEHPFLANELRHYDLLRKDTQHMAGWGWAVPSAGFQEVRTSDDELEGFSWQRVRIRQVDSPAIEGITLDSIGLFLQAGGDFP